MEAWRTRSSSESNRRLAALALLLALAATAFIRQCVTAYGIEESGRAGMNENSASPKRIVFLRADDPVFVREAVRQSTFFSATPGIDARLQRAAGL
jgi:hypothetical protein